MSDESSIFDGIETAKVTGDSNWILPGKYTATIVAVKKAKKFTGEVFVAIEMKIATVIENGDGVGHKVGEDITHLLKVANPSFLGNFKQFISATLGCEADDVTKKQADRVTSDEQPMAGRVVLFTARQIELKNGNPFTKVMYLGEADETEGDEA